jgi:PhnB protein
MTTVNPYLSFNGNCEEAFNFYKSIFQSEFQFLGRYKDVPGADRKKFTISDDKIMHISLPIGGGTVLMGCDSAEPTTVGNSISLSISTDTKESADDIFNGLSIGGQVLMPLADTFWGSYFGGVIDRFGIRWTVSFDSVNQ